MRRFANKITINQNHSHTRPGEIPGHQTTMKKTIDEIASAVRDALIGGTYNVSSYQPSHGDYVNVDVMIDDERFDVTIYPDGNYAMSFLRRGVIDNQCAKGIFNSVYDSRIAKLQSQIDEINALKK